MARARRIAWPALPKTVQGIGGPIRIVFRRTVTASGDAAWGTWDDSTRTVSLVRNMARSHQWRILFHELAHAALADSGLQHLLTEDANESFSDAMASARMAEMRESLSR